MPLLFRAGPKRDFWTLSDSADTRSFDDAKAACREEGNHLANIMFEEENELLQEFLENEMGNTAFWIGANRPGVVRLVLIPRYAV